MKKLFLFVFLSLFSFNFAQNKKCMEREIIFSEEKFIFHSAFNGGDKTSGFSIINNQEELDLAMGQGKILSVQGKNNETKLKFPKNQKVILYNLGEFRAGNHQPQGIEKIKLNGDTLEVYLKKRERKTSTPTTERRNRLELEIKGLEPQIQVVSTPWMIFSIPKKLNFTNIILK